MAATKSGRALPDVLLGDPVAEGATRAQGDEPGAEDTPLAGLGGVRPEDRAPVQDEPHRAEADQQRKARDHDAERQG